MTISQISATILHGTNLTKKEVMKMKIDTKRIKAGLADKQMTYSDLAKNQEYRSKAFQPL